MQDDMLNSEQDPAPDSESPQAQIQQQRLVDHLQHQGMTLGPGWRTKVTTRQSGTTVGSRDAYYISPTGRPFRSKVEVGIEIARQSFKPLTRTEAAANAKTTAEQLDKQLPFTLDNGTTVVQLGKVHSWPTYHSRTQLWPAGYQARWQDPEVGTFQGDILQGGHEGPQFVISLLGSQGEPNQVLEDARDIKEVLKQLADSQQKALDAALTMKQKGKHLTTGAAQKMSTDRQDATAPANPLGWLDGYHAQAEVEDEVVDEAEEARRQVLLRAAPLAGVWGLDRFGLADINVLKLLEALPGVEEQCTGYEYVEQRHGWQVEQMCLTRELQKRGKQAAKAQNSIKKKFARLRSFERSTQAKAAEAEAKREARAAAKRKRREEKQAENAELKRQKAEQKKVGNTAKKPLKSPPSGKYPEEEVWTSHTPGALKPKSPLQPGDRASLEHAAAADQETVEHSAGAKFGDEDVIDAADPLMENLLRMANDTRTLYDLTSSKADEFEAPASAQQLQPSLQDTTNGWAKSEQEHRSAAMQHTTSARSSKSIANAETGVPIFSLEPMLEGKKSRGAESFGTAGRSLPHHSAAADDSAIEDDSAAPTSHQAQVSKEQKGNDPVNAARNEQAPFDAMQSSHDSPDHHPASQSAHLEQSHTAPQTEQPVKESSPRSVDAFIEAVNQHLGDKAIDSLQLEHLKTAVYSVDELLDLSRLELTHVMDTIADCKAFQLIWVRKCLADKNPQQQHSLAASHAERLLFNDGQDQIVKMIATVNIDHLQHRSVTYQQLQQLQSVVDSVEDLRALKPSELTDVLQRIGNCDSAQMIWIRQYLAGV